MKTYQKKEVESFTMRPPRLYVGIYAVCGVAFLLFILLFINSNLEFEAFLISPLLIGSFYQCVYEMTHRIEVDKHLITLHRIFRKQKYIKVAEMKSIQRNKENNVMVVYVYSENKCLFNYNLLYQNAELFEELVTKLQLKNREWKN